MIKLIRGDILRISEIRGSQFDDYNQEQMVRLLLTIFGSTSPLNWLITQQGVNHSQTLSFPGVIDPVKATNKEIDPITYFNLLAVLRGNTPVAVRSLADILVAKIDNALSITILAIGPQRDIPSLDYVHSAIGHLMQLGENHQFTYANCNITDANGNPILSGDQLSHSQL